jgi:hypothetical protein
MTKKQLYSIVWLDRRENTTFPLLCDGMTLGFLCRICGLAWKRKENLDDCFVVGYFVFFLYHSFLDDGFLLLSFNKLTEQRVK